MILLLAALAVATTFAQAGKAKRHGNAPKTAAKVAFDGGRAYEHIRQLVAFGPRPPGSTALEQTRQYIKRELKAAGIDAVDQAFDADTPLGRFRMVNLVARIPGALPDRVVFGGHYDTKLFRQFRFVGANDAGSSTAFLIEWARVLKARSNRFTSEIVFFDGEEALREEWLDPDNRYGSRHFVKTARDDGSLRQIRAMILVDMVGERDVRLRRESGSTRWLTDVIWAAARRLGRHDAFADEEMAVDDDHMPFVEAGIPAVDLIDLDYPAWHTAGDTLDKVSARSLQVVGEVLAGALPEIEKRLAATGKAGKAR